MRAQTQYAAFRAGLFALATLPFVGCQSDAPQTGAAEQPVFNPPLPSNLNLAMNAKTTVTIGPFARAFGDVASSGPTGLLLFDVNSTQGAGLPDRRSTGGMGALLELRDAPATPPPTPGQSPESPSRL